jgi:hydrogenase maturation factor HypF (carbamoyltransferase family)
LFYDNGEYVLYSALEKSNKDVVEDSEEIINESEVIDFYITHNDKISEEFYDDGTAQVDEIILAETESVSKAQMYSDLIEGYELALELESDEEKIKMYNALIEGYQLALELEN